MIIIELIGEFIIQVLFEGIIMGFFKLIKKLFNYCGRLIS